MANFIRISFILGIHQTRQQASKRFHEHTSFNTFLLLLLEYDFSMNTDRDEKPAATRKNVWVYLVIAEGPTDSPTVAAEEEVKLYGQAFQVKDFEGNIDDLKMKIKEEKGMEKKVELTIYQIKDGSMEVIDDLPGQFQLDTIAGSRLSPRKSISEISDSETIGLIAAYRRAPATTTQNDVSVCFSIFVV